LGQGDLELLAFIASFTGPAGCIMTLFIGSTLGALIGIAYISLFKQNRETMIPFGPFLALGAMTYSLFQNGLFLIPKWAIFICFLAIVFIRPQILPSHSNQN
jgi:prepilin signal peptidase PulO-like enzyme (type II secretory pathway)